MNPEGTWDNYDLWLTFSQRLGFLAMMALKDLWFAGEFKGTEWFAMISPVDSQRVQPMVCQHRHMFLIKAHFVYTKVCFGGFSSKLTMIFELTWL